MAATTNKKPEADKKPLELDARIEAIIREEYSDYKIYLTTPQDRAQYDRKQNEYWDRIRARLKEGAIDGRTADEPVSELV